MNKTHKDSIQSDSFNKKDCHLFSAMEKNSKNTQCPTIIITLGAESILPRIMMGVAFKLFELN